MRRCCLLEDTRHCPDIRTEPSWRKKYRDIALSNGIRAAWSEPILTNENQVLGTFAVYSSEPRGPADADLALLEAAGRLALIAIERQRSQDLLRSALARSVVGGRASPDDRSSRNDRILQPDGRALRSRSCERWRSMAIRARRPAASSRARSHRPARAVQKNKRRTSENLILIRQYRSDHAARIPCSGPMSRYFFRQLGSVRISGTMTRGLQEGSSAA